MQNAPATCHEMDSTTCFDFGPPQFSEEFIWLPDCLQQCRSQRPGDKKECERPPEVLLLSKQSADGGNVEGPREKYEARCADFQLFLSEEDGSPINFSPNPARANHFYPRLSFMGSTQQSKNQAFDEAEAVSQSSKDFQREKIRSTVQPSAKTSAQCNSCRKSVRHVKDDDIDASIELSIAASEAVVIHDLVESEPALRPLPMQSVMEVAMRVKEARLQKIDDMSDVTMEGTCADDSLMDFDDLTMLDAFQDVGLLMVIHDEDEFCDADISQVPETPEAEIRNTIDREYKCLDITHGIYGSSGQGNSLTELALEERLKEKFPLQFLNCQMACDVSKELPCKGSLLLQREKGLDAAILEKLNMPKCVPKISVCETSFLSESADEAQDQNSVAQNPGSYVGATSHLKVFLHDSYHVANNCIPFSQEVVGSSSTSLAVPLCSVVPSSIPNENDKLGMPASRVSMENLSYPKALFGSGNLCKTTQERNELAKDSTEPKEDCHNQTGFQRSFLSLKTYNVPPPSCDTKLANTRLSPILPGYSGLIPPMNLLEYDRRLTGNLCAEGTTAVGNVKGGQINNIEHCTGSISGECMKEAADLLLCEKQERKLPLITDDRKNHLFPQAFHYLARVRPQRNEEKLNLTPPNALKVCQRKKILQIKLQPNYIKFRKVPGRIRVRLSGVDMELPLGGDISFAENKCTLKRSAKRLKHFNSRADHPFQDMKNLAKVKSNDEMPLLFNGIGFLITGLSRSREKEIEILIHKHGGVVILNVPSTNTRRKHTSNDVFKHFLVVISPKKLKTTKFLYGCAVGALLLNLSWIMDSIATGYTLPPENYRILPNCRDALIMDKAKSFHRTSAGCIFSRVGFVLHGKRRFFMKFAKVIKHGGGDAYGNLHQLIQRLDSGKVFTGIIVTEHDDRPSRHLHQCAEERKIVMMPASWLIVCLYSGELLSPFGKN